MRRAQNRARRSLLCAEMSPGQRLFGWAFATPARLTTLVLALASLGRAFALVAAPETMDRAVYDAFIFGRYVWAAIMAVTGCVLLATSFLPSKRVRPLLFVALVTNLAVWIGVALFIGAAQPFNPAVYVYGALSFGAALAAIHVAGERW